MKSLLSILKRGTDCPPDTTSWTPKCKAEQGHTHLCIELTEHGYRHRCACGFRWAD